MTSLWQLLLLWGVGVGIGTGMTALVLGATVATRWFVAQRGLVIGVLTASVATGQLIFLPLLTSLAVDYGWRTTERALRRCLRRAARRSGPQRRIMRARCHGLAARSAKVG